MKVLIDFVQVGYPWLDYFEMIPFGTSEEIFNMKPIFINDECSAMNFRRWGKEPNRNARVALY